MLEAGFQPTLLADMLIGSVEEGGTIQRDIRDWGSGQGEPQDGNWGSWGIGIYILQRPEDLTLVGLCIVTISMNPSGSQQRGGQWQSWAGSRRHLQGQKGPRWSMGNGWILHCRLGFPSPCAHGILSSPHKHLPFLHTSPLPLLKRFTFLFQNIFCYFLNYKSIFLWEDVTLKCRKKLNSPIGHPES